MQDEKRAARTSSTSRLRVLEEIRAEDAGDDHDGAEDVMQVNLFAHEKPTGQDGDDRGEIKEDDQLERRDPFENHTGQDRGEERRENSQVGDGEGETEIAERLEHRFKCSVATMPDNGKKRKKDRPARHENKRDFRRAEGTNQYAVANRVARRGKAGKQNEDDAPTMRRINPGALHPSDVHDSGNRNANRQELQKIRPLADEQGGENRGQNRGRGGQDARFGRSDVPEESESLESEKAQGVKQNDRKEPEPGFLAKRP